MRISIDQSRIADNILSFIKNKLGESKVADWFKDSQIIFDKDGIGTIVFPNHFIKDWVLSHYADAIQEAFNCICKTTMFHTAISSQVQEKAICGEISNNSLPLDPKMRFDTFVVGKSNEMAFESAKRVSKDMGIFNPLFLYGHSGFGKTHLLEAIAWQAKSNGKNVCYISAEQYMVSFIKALQNHTIMEFKNSFRDIDILLLDDFQFLAGKNSTQEEIFYNFTDLIAKKKQLVVSADKKPSELSGIAKRLRSRLGAGLPVYIHPASYELRLGILEQKAKQYDKKIDKEIISIIAENVDSNVRELVGALMRICAQIEFFGYVMTPDSARHILKEMFNPSDASISVDDIIDSVLHFYNITKEVLYSGKRLKHIVKARQIAMFLCREIAKKSLPEIGKIFGGKDHTTALYATKIVKDKASKCPIVSREISELKGLIAKASQKNNLTSEISQDGVLVKNKVKYSQCENQ